MLDLSLSDFDISDRAKFLFAQEGWTEGSHLLENLERYKFVDRGTIVSKCKEKGLFNVRSMSAIKSRDKSLSVENSLAEAERRFNVLIEVTGPDSVCVYSPLYQWINTKDVMVLLPVADVSLVYITPSNYRDLKGLGNTDWDYRFMMLRLVLDAMELGSTDIHISTKSLPTGPVFPILYRIGNDAVERELFKLDAAMNKALIITVISKMAESFEGDLAQMEGVTTNALDVFKDGSVTLRLTAREVFTGFKLTCRIQDIKTVSLTVEKLGFGASVEEDLKLISRTPSGLTLVTGAQRVGKNTTIFAIANEMCEMPITMLDLSDPIEFQMPCDQIDYKGNLTRLAHITRQCKKMDLDVLIMNEIPNKEIAREIEGLVNSSVHVMTTFHINRIWHLPHKLYEFYGESYKNVFSQLNGCFNQKMYDRLCPDCLHEYAVSELPARYRDVLLAHDVTSYFKPKGCPKCTRKLGKVGRIGPRPLMERFLMTDDLHFELMKCNHPFEMQSVLKRHVKSLGWNLEVDICRAIGEGVIDYESLDSVL